MELCEGGEERSCASVQRSYGGRRGAMALLPFDFVGGGVERNYASVNDDH